MAIWDDVITERDKLVYEKAGWGKRAGFGARPAVLVVDVNYNFVGDVPEPILTSIERWPYSCGEEGWEGVYNIRGLLIKAREKRLPIFYTSGERRPDGLDFGSWNWKSYRAAEPVHLKGHLGNEIVKEIAPEPKDFLIVKSKPSAFFGTPLLSFLINLKVDTAILTGTTTSGCIRATVLDGFSNNIRMIVPEECVWDRGQTTHKINLFDIHMKYGDVVPLKEVEDYIDSLPEGLFSELS